MRFLIILGLMLGFVFISNAQAANFEFHKDFYIYRDFQKESRPTFKSGFDSFKPSDFGSRNFYEEYRMMDNRLQRYVNSQAQWGDFYRRQPDGSWLRYENWVPQWGDFYRRQPDGSLLQYDNWVPQY